MAHELSVCFRLQGSKEMREVGVTISQNFGVGWRAWAWLLVVSVRWGNLFHVDC